jgi:acyl-coenzyme A synthetase/AMP-(fatty) acid ligase
MTGDEAIDAPSTVVPRAHNSVGCCLFTSGSTGTPKGVLISEADLFARAAAEVECFGLGAGDVLLCVLPFSFDVGLNQLLSAIVAGCAIVASESWLPADIVRHTARFGVTGICAVPAIWNDLLNSPLRFNGSREHRSLRYVTVSGGDLPPIRLQQLQLAIGNAGIIKTYGQSETFRSSALLPADFAQKPHSVGKAFASARVYVVRPDGSRAAPNEPGEIVHTGIGTMLGYLDAQAGDDNLRQNPFRGQEDPAAKAVFTGDIGWLDEDGFLFVQGRHDGMLKIAGNRVYPQEIARQLGSLPGVREVEIVGTRDAAGETAICAFVVPAHGAQLDPTGLRGQLMQLLPSYMVPKQIRVVPQIDRTESGKPDRPALIAQL